MNKTFLYFFLFFTIGVIGAIVYLDKAKLFGDTKIVNKTLPVQTPTPIPTYSLEKAPSESLKAEIVTMSGDISWQSRTATEPAKLVNPRVLQQGEDVETGKNSNLTFAFKDVAKVELTDNSRVGIVQSIPANLVFTQTSGSATYEKLGDYPVSIRCQRLLVDIVGGQTEIIVNKVNPSLVTVIVNGGSATVAYNSLSNIATKNTIEKGYEYIFNNVTRSGIKRAI